MNRVIILPILLLLSVFTLRAQYCTERYTHSIYTEDITVQQNIVFGNNNQSNGNNKTLYLDFYEPTNDAEALRPLIIFLHGGGYLGGNKDIPEAALPCAEMAKRGYAAASVQYRTEENALALIFPDIMIKAVVRSAQDAKAAIRFFYRQAKIEGNPYRIDTNQIFIGGVSSGAIAALHAVYMDNPFELESDFRRYANDVGGLEGNSGNEGYSTKVRGVLNISGGIRDRNYFKNNTETPLLSIHHHNDPVIPTYYGRPFAIPTLPSIVGSYPIAKYMDNMGMYNMLYKVPGKRHVPYVDGSRIIQPAYDSTMWYMSSFMYSLLDCNPNKIVTTLNPSIRPPEELSIYPNPTDGFIVLAQSNFGDKEAAILRIIDLSGNLRGEHFFDGNNEPVDLIRYNLSDGIYIVEAYDKNQNKLAQQRLVLMRR